MPKKLKPLSEQVIVITGASSGIGLVTARQAARRGARLVLCARNEKALHNLAEELKEKGCDAIYVAADVGIEADVQGIADRAIAYFGGFDTWVNNAGVSIYGSLDQGSMEEYRRLFETNFWGVVHGSLIARRHLRLRGGAIITVGSLASDIGTPVQSMYAASKHAAKGFLDGLRMETEKEGAPITITLIKPASIDSMLPAHACNHMPVEPRLPPPVYAPDTVAEAILYAAEYPSRDIFVGGMAAIGAAGAYYTPRLADRITEAFAIPYQKKESREKRTETGNLFIPTDEGLRERQGYSGVTFEHSLYTRAVTVWRRPMLAFGVTAAFLGMLQYRRRSGRTDRHNY